MQRALQVFSQLIRLLRPAPGIFLFFIAPLIGALLSGSIPPNSFFNLLTLLFLCFLYGGGAIIARELTLYWGKGWPTLLMLGAAFGVINEGVLVKSFFDPRWKDLGLLGTYGRVLDVNWVWSVQTIIFQAIFSIAIPILIVNLLFPKRHAERWAGPRALLLLIVVFMLAVVFGSLFLFPYRPALLLYLIAVVIVAALVLLARMLPRAISVTKSIDVPQPLRFGLVGFLGTLTLYLVNWILPTTLTPFWVTIVLTVLLACAIGFVLLRMSGNALGWTERHQVALVSGALAFYILLAPIVEITQRQTDHTGLTFLALLVVGLLYLLTRRIRKREQKQQQSQQQRAVI
jgi:predicted outer membrane lipoprotein